MSRMVSMITGIGYIGVESETIYSMTRLSNNVKFDFPYILDSDGEQILDNLGIALSGDTYHYLLDSSAGFILDEFKNTIKTM